MIAERTAPDTATSLDGDRLYALQAFPARLLVMNADGTDVRTLVNGLGGTPDGLTVDLKRGHLYWTNMGAKFGENDGFIERCDLDGGNRTVIVSKGKTFTPKQIEYDPVTDRLYWCDREGMRVMRARRDGSEVTVLVQTGSGDRHRRDQRRHCVGIAVDPYDRFLYWTQKGPGNGGVGYIMRASLDLGPRDDPENRADVEVLLDRLPEPIDLMLDDRTGTLYWTDRGRAPRGNTLNAARVGAAGLTEHHILMKGLWEGIGVCANVKRDTLFVTDLILGHVRRFDLARGKARTIRRGWPLTGIVCAPAMGFGDR
jgi:DNA-binding beta-propeller fold protein YncE